jgi:uncharacterized membrane protein YqjE
MGKERDLRERPLGELFARLGRELSLLVQQEIELAQTELSERVRIAVSGAAFLSVGGLLGFFAFAALTTAIILAVALALPGWASALVVAAGYGSIAGIFALIGRGRMRRAQPLAPQTVQTLKENVEWAKIRMKSGIK